MRRATALEVPRGSTLCLSLLAPGAEQQKVKFTYFPLKVRLCSSLAAPSRSLRGCAL
jgi:hypothetical protein